MRIAIKLGLATVIAAMMVWTLACGAETAGDRPPEPELRESETILEATATAPATEEQPTRPDATEVRTNRTVVRGTLIPKPEVQTDGGTNRAVTEEPSPTRRDGEVYVAPKHVPTETPTPTADADTGRRSRARNSMGPVQPGGLPRADTGSSTWRLVGTGNHDRRAVRTGGDTGRNEA